MLVIDASSLFRNGRAQNPLDPEHTIETLHCYRDLSDVENRARVAGLDEIEQEGWTRRGPIGQTTAPRSAIARQGSRGLSVAGFPCDDRWHYKTPILRNVALTRPYMHDGSLLTLEDVVAFYDRGGVPNPLLDPRIRPLNLSAQDEADLVAFLESLTGDYRPLVLDAFVAPVGDLGSRYGDPSRP